MEVHFAPPDFVSLDQLKTETLCLPLFVDERPLRGVAGLIDWRLCGRISELLVNGKLRGDVGEAVLMPARPRLTPERLLWLGAGERDHLDEARFREFVRALMERLVRLRVRSASLVLPGRALDRVKAAQAMEWFLEESAAYADRVDEMTILDSEDARRAMQPIVDRARRRALTDI